MCFPPFDSVPTKPFITANKLALSLILKELSMGMSSDYDKAIINGSTFLRLGTTILGKRNIT
jgi:Predicted enzyme with a TIM-barrel fold